jgi:DNA-directed RNA polymerase subunit RPC12/RpoP
MTTTSNESGLYILRLLVVIIAFVGLPSFPFLFLSFVPERYRWIFLLWIPLGFWLWSRLSRRLLVESRYICPKCSKKIARIEVVERGDVGDVYLACPVCGFREKSDDVAWHAPSG